MHRQSLYILKQLLLCSVLATFKPIHNGPAD